MPQVRFYGQKLLAPEPKDLPDYGPQGEFAFPRDIEIITEIAVMDHECVFSGSFADQIHIGKKEINVKDLDVNVGNATLQKCLSSKPARDYAEEFRKDPDRWVHTMFDAAGFAEQTGDGFFIDGIEYPRQMLIKFGRKTADLFLYDPKRMPSKQIDFHGKEIRIVALEHRIKMLQSMLDNAEKSEWLMGKKQSVEQRINILKSIK